MRDCHSSTDPLVTDAIAAGDKSCATCHPEADHAALHTTVDAGRVAARTAGCHPGTNLLPIHAMTLACADCHSSTEHRS